jgi:hypothetical protein
VADLWADISRQLVQGADVLLGAFIDAGSAAFAAYLADRRRFKREDKYRDYADRRQVYLEFLASWHSYEETRTRTPRDQKEFEEASLELQRRFNALSLIAPEEVRAAAVSVREGEDGAPGRFWKAARKDLDKWPSWWRRAFGKLLPWWRRTFGR